MELSLKNVGKIKEAAIVLDGITVIAGENDTGKTTISRALFLMLDSSCDVQKKVEQEMERSLLNCLFLLRRKGDSINSLAFARNIMEHSEEFIENPSRLRDELKRHLKNMNEEIIDQLKEDVLECLQVSEEEIFVSILEKNINDEFYGQIQNIYTQKKAEIQFSSKDLNASLEIEEGVLIWNDELIGRDTSVLYLDDPAILNSLRYNLSRLEGYAGHQQKLKSKLTSEQGNTTIVGEIVATKKLDHVYKMISKVFDGEIVAKDLAYGYQKESDGEFLDIKNLSDGLKTFAILKTLLLNGSIQTGSVIILDEPEIHLHPEWQLLFAEIIVLLHKEFDLYILLNTHSHYFLDAIETYSQKHDVVNSCRYYLASLDGNFASIEDVTGNTEEIYKKLARPLQRLENERYRDET